MTTQKRANGAGGRAVGMVLAALLAALVVIFGAATPRRADFELAAPSAVTLSRG